MITPKREERGNVAIELSLSIPLLLLILLGVADFGRAMSQLTAIQQAAMAGAQYATIDTTHYTDLVGINTAALADIPNITGATVTSDRYCTCGWGAPNDCSTTCSSKRMYVEVKVQAIFRPMVTYPGIPAASTMVGKTTVRLQ